MVLEAVQVRGQVEGFHRSFKQLTGAEKCRCRKAEPSATTCNAAT